MEYAVTLFCHSRQSIIEPNLSNQGWSMVKPREANSTLKLIDEYCRYYRNLFSEVRSFEAFPHFHTGIISERALLNWGMV